LYMTVITLATVGYGETHPLSTGGRVFTMAMILGGMSIILYALTEVTAFIVEGEMTGLLRRRTMNKKIGKLSGHYILCGAGKSGTHTLAELQSTKRPCVVIEMNHEKAQHLLEHDVLVIEGDATLDESLKAAGIERAKGLVSTLTTDKDNLFVVITARGLNPHLRIIAKVEEVTSRDKFMRSGANAIVSTNFIGGLRMASELIRPATTTFLDKMLREDSTLRVEEVNITSRSGLAHKKLRECDVLNTHAAMLVSVKRDEHFTFHPSDDFVLAVGDALIMIGNADQMSSLRKAVEV
ncbi:MAG: potassium channel protein, partial [Ignavibacteriales bacterium]|nr:potassium channel protein [Ignavibacteriales bacterium]